MDTIYFWYHRRKDLFSCLLIIKIDSQLEAKHYTIAYEKQRKRPCHDYKLDHFDARFSTDRMSTEDETESMEVISEEVTENQENEDQNDQNEVENNGEEEETGEIQEDQKENEAEATENTQEANKKLIGVIAANKTAKKISLIGRVPKSCRTFNMELAKALGILGFNNTRWMETCKASGITPKQVLDKAHFAKTMYINKQRVS